MPYKCREEKNRKAKEYRRKNKDKINAKRRATRDYSNPSEQRKEYLRKYRAENKAKIRQYYLDNAEELKQKARERNRANPTIDNLRSSLKRAWVKKATPPWVCKDSLLSYYKQSKEFEILLGVKHHVDHIVPLRHPLICGLNIPRNLQVIPASVNLKKSNSFEPYSIEH